MEIDVVYHIWNGQAPERRNLQLQVLPVIESSSLEKKKLILHKIPGDRLGLQLAAGAKKGSVKVKGIADGSPAHKCVDLRQDEKQLLSEIAIDVYNCLVLSCFLFCFLLLLLLFFSIGDELVSVNGADVSAMGVDIVRTLLTSYPPGDIELEVLPENQR